MSFVFVCHGETNMTFQILIIIKRERKETDKKILKHKGKLGKRQISNLRYPNSKTRIRG